MDNTNRNFPPPKIMYLDRLSASNFLALLRDSNRTPLTLIIGAGVSASAGLPLWNTLLDRICTTFFYHWGFDITRHKGNIAIPPHELSVAFIGETFRSNDAIEASALIVKQDLLLVAQQIKNCIRSADWRYLLRKIIYKYDPLGEANIKNSALVRSLVRLCLGTSNLRSIISYNWDNILEISLKEVGYKFNSIWKSKQRISSGSIPLYYPHGYLPFAGGPNTELILSEGDYHQEISEPYSWANLIQLQAYCSSVCIFIGTSMTDPNLRRLLRVSVQASLLPKYAFLPSVSQTERSEIIKNVLFDRELASLGIKVIRYPLTPSLEDAHSRLTELIDILCQHQTDKNRVWGQEENIDKSLSSM